VRVKDIPLGLIDIADENVRKNDAFGEDEEDLEFASNVQKMDLFQPVVVRYDKSSRRYKLLIGRRRFFSYKEKGEKTIPAVISTLEGAEARAASLFENMMRRDLTPLDKAQRVKDLIEITSARARRIWQIWNSHYCGTLPGYWFHSENFTAST